MKNKSTFWIILGCLFIAGVALSGIGIYMGGRLFSFHFHNIKDKGYQNSPLTLTEEEADSIDSLDFDFNASEVTILKGDEYTISGNGYYKSDVDDGVWNIKSTMSSWNISFLSHHINFPNFWSDFTNNHKITVTLPEETFEEIKFRTSAASVKVESLNCKNADIKTEAGSMHCDVLETDNLTLKTGAGDTVIHSIQVSEQADVKLSAGNIVLGKEGFTTTNSINNLSLKTGIGNCNLNSKLTGSNKLKCSTGNLSVNLAGSRSNYNISSSSNIGDVDIDDSETHGADNSDSELYGSIEIKSNLSDIDIDFIS